MVHTIVIHNTGNTWLRGVGFYTSLTTNGTAAAAATLTAYACSIGSGAAFTLPGAGTELPVASTLSCMASYTFGTIDTIEAGDLRFDASLTAIDVAVLPPVSPVTVAVINSPRVAVFVNATACDAPSTAGEKLCGATVCVPSCCVHGIAVFIRLISNAAVVALLLDTRSRHHDMHRWIHLLQSRQRAREFHLGGVLHWCCRRCWLLCRRRHARRRGALYRHAANEPG